MNSSIVSRVSGTFDKYINDDLEQLIISNPSVKTGVTKVKIRPVLLKGSLKFQAAETIGQKELHKNYSSTELKKLLCRYAGNPFRQFEIKSHIGRAVILIGKKGTVTIKDIPAVKSRTDLPDELSPDRQNNSDKMVHNKRKSYILSEGVHIPFMVDLGIMTSEGKIINSKYDKYRQINRYLEFIEDVLPALPKNRELSIIDFGCGKSYLTFAMYYYLHEMKGYNITITGLDLKKEVIDTCNELKNRYGYEKLEFLQGDIAEYNGTGHVDMVVTLHACDTATDYALYNAITWDASVILCVPCCQHELNRQINNIEMKDLLKYGIVKERMAALMTDGLRAALLEEQGYKVQMLEFIDMEHTPKNILIRAVRHPLRVKTNPSYRKTLELFNVNPLLYRLLHPDTVSQNYRSR